MNVYIWESVDKLTDSYHDDGGVVVVARTLERARELIAEPWCTAWLFDDQTHDDHECRMHSREACTALTEAPDFVLPSTDDQPERLIVFPNAGCC